MYRLSAATSLPCGGIRLFFVLSLVLNCIWQTASRAVAPDDNVIRVKLNGIQQRPLGVRIATPRNGAVAGASDASGATVANAAESLVSQQQPGNDSGRRRHRVIVAADAAADAVADANGSVREVSAKSGISKNNDAEESHRRRWASLQRTRRQLDFNIDAEHEDGVGTDVMASLRANLYKNERTQVDATARYTQHFSEMSGPGKGKIGGSLHLSHQY